MINWEAIGAGGAVGAVIFALFQTMASGFRSSILYNAIALRCETERTYVYALRVEMKNFSLRHINDMVVRVECKNKPIGLEIWKTSSINKKTVSTEFIDGELIIKIPDMPRFEKIGFDLFAECHLSDYRPLTGGNKEFVLKPKKDYMWVRVNLAIISAVVAINVFQRW